MKPEAILHILTMFPDVQFPSWWTDRYFINKDQRQLYNLLKDKKDTTDFYGKHQDLFASVMDQTGTQDDLEGLCEKVKDDCHRHWSDRMLTNLIHDFRTGTGSIEDVQYRINEFVSNMQKSYGSDTIHIMDAAGKMYAESIESKKNPEARKYIETGWSELDRYWTLYKKKIHMIAARPSMGKSAFAQYISLLLAKNGHSGLFFSIEMPEYHISARIVASEAMVNSMILMKGAEDLPHIWESIHDLEDVPLFINTCRSPSISYICNTIRRQKPDFVVIDHLAHIPVPKGMDKRVFIDHIITELEIVADQLDIPVILLHQLNRNVEYRDDKHPIMSDLKESGEIEQKAESVLLLYRPEYYLANKKIEMTKARTMENFQIQEEAINDKIEKVKDKIEINVAKMRGGETGKLDARFNKPFMRFENWDE